MKDVDKSVKKALDYEEKPKDEQVETLDSSLKENAEEAENAERAKAKQPQKKQVEDQKPAVDLKYSRQDFKKASNGKEWNFKIASWNINGVRAWIEVSLRTLTLALA